MEAVKDVFLRSWVGMGPKVNEFEEEWKRFINCKDAVALNSATAALHLALKVFDFPAGKKVLVPSLTFSATASAILYNNLIPVFIDSDPITLGMSIDDMYKKYTNDCVAIIPVHYAGHPVDMEPLISWAHEKKLKVIEDCAHTSGSMYKGTKLGLWGDIGCYSFEEKKLMTTGDGGMMVTNSPDIFKDVRAMRWVGIDKDNWKAAQKYTDANQDAMHWFYELNTLGYKYNMNDLAASIGLVQLKKLPSMNDKRSRIILKYMDGLKNINGLSLLLPYEPNKYSYQIFGVRLKSRDNLMIYLKSKGIATGCHYTPLSVQPLFKQWGFNCPYIEEEINSCITLPLHPELSFDDVDYVVENIKNFMSNY
jgi:perosamine synthetase